MDNIFYQQSIINFVAQYACNSKSQLVTMVDDTRSTLRVDAYRVFENTLSNYQQWGVIEYSSLDSLLKSVAVNLKTTSESESFLVSQLATWWQEWYFALSMHTTTSQHNFVSVHHNIEHLTQHNKPSTRQHDLSEYVNLFTQVPIPLCNVCMHTENIIRINQRFVDVFGYTIDDIPTLNDWWLNAYPDPHYLVWVRQTWQQALSFALENDTDIQPQVYCVTCKDGSHIMMEISGRYFKHEFLAIFKDVTQHLAVEDTLRDMAFVDSLTQIANRRCFDDKLVNELELMHKKIKPLSMLLIDIDYFKQYNDNYGHIKGDECLYQIAQCIAATMNHEKDFVARFGGEEFVVLLPEADPKKALHSALQIQQAINQLVIKHEYTDIGYITLSMGIKTLHNPQTGDYTYFVDAADKALYQAKGQGRNCIVVSED
ncbi:MAG: sensor domain-containing diguanylate cyclase [Pseudoalteromonas prydzensis]|uniref:diguanylate cyclase n=1 Tax=Pseudoalteromonas prydzensis TaxID=182141 RepID=A0A7V1D315_9GAMM|nr:sensor domain-containing diguanylate cyclase [Pseudoalteromonas prydzensis]HEA18959.1 diguanylate cyclase [Pseudoalteromonas prydzensis]